MANLSNESMINKNIEDIEYSDIEILLRDKVEESDTLDYKEEMIEPTKLLKHVCAFANTRGGDIVFGLRESGKGGYPIKILGLSEINKESIEQIILCNITPRLSVSIKTIENSNSVKIMILRIPNGNMKPYFNCKDQKYYKRFQYESTVMNEQEICDCYKRRFSNNDDLNQYINNLISNTEVNVLGITIARIVIIPSNIEHRLINTINYEELKWIETIKLKFDFNDYVCRANLSDLKFFSQGIMFQEIKNRRVVEIHRNGCIQCILNLKNRDGYFDERTITIALLQSLDLCSKILTHYGYPGEIRILLNVQSISKISLPRAKYVEKDHWIGGIDYTTSREHSLQYVANNPTPIAASIMHDIANNFGEEKCHFFNDDGTLNEEKFQ